MTATRQNFPIDPATLPASAEARYLANGWHALALGLDSLPADATEAAAAIEARMDDYAARLRTLAAEHHAYLTTPEAPYRGRLA
jgi:hypothetical protein